ncbi:hypothetical protein EMIHUDRAFT_314847 [Emiliania huxleyi CCMP1516]|uniref:RNA cytidine acetyltransferase n=2 Tax=Emiliania huxleyi TaxID=2903 RepID=A0A0D3JYR4_EMIH1|nr:hypothetical protein EMIHUDRAFT_314847 [Emiliania huxleyi CCMP1516]EOD28649.1 hypothetical protein EMIHUDRAFT_314847 [Emiliania huxleyi CCMP1516]|eukprot:XP_005781078.1 hypothetical protein EMIHUDRAFT_314847 [Emiliania huxleyi CCMP1516]
MRKKVDARVRTLIENSVALRHRGLFVIVGDSAREQVVNLHYMLSKAAVRARPSVLWCYKKELGFTTHRKKRMRHIKKMAARGLIDPDKDDPFELFISSTSITYCYYRETTRVLGNTFGMLVLQDFEAVTPNVLARTVETGGGIVVMLLKSMDSLRQLYTMTMDAHARFRTEAQPQPWRGHRAWGPRFNERFILSLASCRSCLVLDDELNILPISSHAAAITPVSKGLRELKRSLRETQPVGSIVQTVRTVDQAKALLTFVEAAADKSLRCTVALTAARGRGKSAALGLSLAAAVAYGYANIFVTAPSPENLRTLFEFVLKGFDALEYKEHADFSIVESTNPELKHTVVRINIFRAHRQTIQYILPSDAALLSQAELLVIDEAAAIPLPQVRALLGPYLVYMASTVNGYEGTGRALSLKLIQQLRAKAQAGGEAAGGSASALAEDPALGGRTLREARGSGGEGGWVSLEEPIRYAQGDPVERWLHGLLCLDATTSLPPVRSTPHPSECELYWVDRDALFSYHSASEAFLQRMLALCVSSHYKNTPNDLQLLSDAPAHQAFVLLGPVDVDAKRLPDILAVVQICLEGDISHESVRRSMARGETPSGDLIAWTVSQQFQEPEFASLSGARVVRVAVHPDLARMGYGSRALDLLTHYYQGDVRPLKPPAAAAPRAAAGGAGADGATAGGLLHETIAPRAKLPPLLLTLEQRPPEPLHWLGASFGITAPLYGFWHKGGFRPVYLRQTKNEVTGEHTAIVLKALDGSQREMSTLAAADWLPLYVGDFRRRLSALLGGALREMPTALALSLLDPTLQPAEARAPTAEQLEFVLGAYDLKRLSSYSRSLVDHHLVLDLVPLLARLRFSGALLTPLSSVQAAILVGVGLQGDRRPAASATSDTGATFDSLSAELGLPVSQLLALFNKLMRKLVAPLQAEAAKAEEASLPAPSAAREASAHLQPLGGDEAARKQQEWLEDGALARYEIKGTEEDWEEALAGRGGPVTGVLSVRSSKEGEAKKRKLGGGGKAKDKGRGDKPRKKSR